MKKLIINTIIAIFAAGTMAASTPVRLAKDVNTAAMEHWVDSVYSTLTLRQKVGQLVFPKVVTTQGENTKATLKKLIDKGHIGGILFTEGSVEQYVEMTNYAQSLTSIPLLMTFDGEWGLSMRIKSTTRFPNNMAIGAARNAEKLAYDYGREMGRQCRAIGIHVNFAPVADVNSNADNPVIGYRSFGENPADVARLVCAYSRGLEDEGVQAVAKHFPGHGDTDSDSHKTLPSVNRSAKTLGTTELIPFNAFIKDGGSGIMMAHLRILAIDPTGTPMSLSRPAYRLLREKLGYTGLTYTDALGMKGAVMPDGSNATVGALKSGADVLLCSRHPLEDIDTIVAEVKAGRIPMAVVDDRCRRILEYKYMLGLADGVPSMDIAQVKKALTAPEQQTVNNRVSASVITALVNKDNILPLKGLGGRSIAVICLGATGDNAFATTVRRYARADVYTGVPEAEVLRKYNTVITAVFNNTESTLAEAKKIATSKAQGLISVFLVNPYKMAGMSALVKASQAVILAYDDTPVLRSYAAQALFGGICVDGRLPVTLKGLFRRGAGLDLPKNRLGYTDPAAEGMNPSMVDSIDALMKAAIADGAMPGAQVLVARHGNVVMDRTYGVLTADGDSVSPFTVYDLASVSKAIGTLPGVMLAVDRGLLDVDAPLSRYIPGLRGTDKEAITVRQALYHQTGIPAALNMFTTMMDTATYSGPLTVSKPDSVHNIKIQNKVYGHDRARMRTDIVTGKRDELHPVEMARGMYVGQAAMDTIMGRIYGIKLRDNADYNYSCLNFALLMDAEQHATGTAHDRWCRENIWKPLGAWTMGYRPTEYLDTTQIAPTEKDTYLRKQTLRGYVHDEMAAFSGGVSGNAGLFANADDIAKMCRMWQQGGTYGGETIMSPETVHLFTTDKSPDSRRGLGFDKPDTANPAYSPTTSIANGSTYGHLGFTGTVFWVDPENDLIVVFLTNRVNPTRDNAAFNRHNPRPAIMRQALQAMTD